MRHGACAARWWWPLLLVGGAALSVRPAVVLPRQLAGGTSEVGRSEDPEARSAHCMELRGVGHDGRGDESVVLCDPASIGEARVGEGTLCWTFNLKKLCSFDVAITTSNFPALSGLALLDADDACACPAFSTCVHDAAVVQATPGWGNDTRRFRLGQCQGDGAAVFGIVVFFALVACGGCLYFIRWRYRANLKVNPIVGAPGGSDVSTGSGTR